MAIVKLQAGAEVDILTAKEQAQLEVRKSQAAARRSPITMREPGEFTTDASGDYDNALVRVPQGSRILVHRVSLWDPAATPAAPSTAGWWALYRNDASGAPLVFAPETTGGPVFPFIYSATSDGLVLAGGETLFLHVVGAAASQGFPFLVEFDIWDAQLPKALTTDELG